MKKIIICVISAIMTIAGVGGKVLVDNKTEKVDNQIPQVVESIVDSSKEELEKATEDVVEKSDEEKSEEKKEEMGYESQEEYLIAQLEFAGYQCK